MSSVIELLVNERKNAALHSDTPTPLYHQMYMMLKNNIINGRIAQGTQMPTEQQLAESFSVSRITAKRAMDELAAEELVERRRGKGTHVTYQYIQKPVQAPLVGMLENLESMGRNTRIRVLDVVRTIPPADIRAELKLHKDEKIHRVIRVRSTKDGDPFAFYTSWTMGVTKDFTKRKLETIPRLEILRLNGMSLARVEQT
jgi:GntR family transcriptional regulator